MADRKIKLLIVIVDIVAGTGTFCRNVSGGLRRLFGDEFDVSLLMMRRRALSADEAGAFDSVHTLGSAVHEDWRRVYETPIDAWKLRRTLRRIDPDLILTIGTYSNLLVSIVAGGDRTIMTEHMNMTQRLRVAPFGRIIGWLMKWRYPRSLIVGAARGITQDLEENFGTRRTSVIPNGLDAERVRRLADEPLEEDPAPHGYSIAVGRLAMQKDYPTLLRAHAAAREKGMADDLVIVGDGEERAALEELAKSLKVAGSVHFLGHRSNPYPLMKRARCLVLSSAFEGFAYVPLEAMALGVPCVATDCPSGPAEILGDGKYGLLVPVGDVQALAQALLTLATEPAARDHYVQQARIRSGQLSVEAMAREYRDLLHEEFERRHGTVAAERLASQEQGAGM